MTILFKWLRPIFLTTFFIFIFVPLAWLLLGSFKLKEEALSTEYLFNFTPTIGAYEGLFLSGLDSVFINSFVIASSNVVLCILLGFPAAYGISNLTRKPRKHVSFTLLTFRLTPAFGVALPLYFLMRSLQLLDTRTSVILAHLTINLPFAIWLFLSYFDNLPKELDEAALLDGATRLQILQKIWFPLSISMIVAVSVLIFVASWNEFLFAFLFTSSSSQTVPALIASLAGTMNFDWPLMNAISIFSMIPPLLFVFFAQKYVVSGLTTGAVKA